MHLLLLAVGIAGLWLGTELTIRGALAVARRHNLSEWVVGLLILSVGSDLPELAVAVDAGVKVLLGQDASGVVIGASIGSVVAQIGLVLGLAALISPLVLPRRVVYRYGAVLLAATVLLFALGYDGHISRVDGVVLVAAYLAYVFGLMNGEAAAEAPTPTSTSALAPALAPDLAHGGLRSWLGLAAGLALVIGGSELTVVSVVAIAHNFELSEIVISILVIGLGTSLPELSISISAIIKRKTALSVGNIIGSNVLDTLLPIGLAALIAPLVFDRTFLTFDLPYIFVITAVVLGLLIGRRGLTRLEGTPILVLYGLYVAVKLQHI
ncbi:MAG: sodium:calcium antiporter [Lysobacterales bacterium]